MSEFNFKEIDAEGHQTLDVISKADKLNRWMYDTISPYCSGNILEIGSGIGNISQFFITENANIALTDIRESYCDILRKKFSGNRVLLLDLVDNEFDTKYADLLGTFDTVFALNVVEHIQDDVLAMQNVKKLLKPSGKAVILVPSYQFLYNQFDVELEHFRRYTIPKLENVFNESGFKILKSWHFNFIGIFGWYVSGKLMKNKTIPEGQMSFYNVLVPIFRLVDKCVFNKIGLSTITVGQK